MYPSDNADTPLSLAAKANCIECVKILLLDWISYTHLEYSNAISAALESHENSELAIFLVRKSNIDVNRYSNFYPLPMFLLELAAQNGKLSNTTVIIPDIFSLRSYGCYQGFN